MSNGDHDQDDEQPRPGSQLDQRCDGAGRGRSMLAIRSVQQSNHCAREDFLYELKAGQRAASGRPRPADRPSRLASLVLPILAYSNVEPWQLIVVS
jgi:hypothetical protein